MDDFSRNATVRKLFKTVSSSYEPQVLLIDLAKKWKKQVAELITWAAKDKLEVHYWYDGHICFVHKGLKLPHPRRFGSNWYKLRGKDLLALQVKKSIPVQYFAQKIAPQNNIVVRIDEIVVMEREVQRMEREFPELLEKKGKVKHPRGGLVGERQLSQVEILSNLHIIGGLVELFLTNGINEKGLLNKQAGIIDAIGKKCQGLKGITKRTMEDRFSKGNKLLSDIEKNIAANKPLKKEEITDIHIIGMLLHLLLDWKKNKKFDPREIVDIVAALVDTYGWLPENASQILMERCTDGYDETNAID